MHYKEHNIKSFYEFENIATKFLPKEGLNPFILRGQADITWNLLPKLARSLIDKGIDHEPDAIAIERKLYHSFIDNHPSLDNKNDLLHVWEIMQHYGYETRLLDWTIDPLIALYFACSTNTDADGAIFVIDAAHVKFIQDARAGFDKDSTDWIFEQLSKSVRGQSHTAAFATISSPWPDQRMLNQKSEFTIGTQILADQFQFADEIVFSRTANRSADNSIFQKIIIPARLKDIFMSELNKKGIDEKTVYPTRSDIVENK